MNKLKPYIKKLETDGVYLADNSGEGKFIPWQGISHFILNIHSKRYVAMIRLKDGSELKVKISEPFKVAHRIYTVLFNYGELAPESLPEFNII